jgi:hypothetical protein
MRQNHDETPKNESRRRRYMKYFEMLLLGAVVIATLTVLYVYIQCGYEGSRYVVEKLLFHR